jgi:hypothetical protein
MQEAFWPLLARMAAKVAAFTMQYLNLLNHRPIGKVKYTLIIFNQQVILLKVLH